MGSFRDLQLQWAVNMLGSTGYKLVDAGKRNVDQLLRALIPLYIANKTHLSNRRITCGDTERFWKLHRVKLRATNAAGVLRWQIGYSRRTKRGVQITPNGIKYVEAALGR